MKTTEFKGRAFKVDNDVRFVTQDARGVIVTHKINPVEREFDSGFPVWVSDDRAEQRFAPDSVCVKL